MLEVDREQLEMVLQTGGEVRSPLFKDNELYENKAVNGLKLGKMQMPLDYTLLNNLLRMAVMESVGKHEKVALLLSGGVDSSLLGRLIRDACPDTDIQAYHTTFNIPERDELPHATRAANDIGVPLTTINCEPLAQIPIIREALKETKTPSYSVGTVYKTMKKIKADRIGVIVNALGLDELFAGYTVHRRFFQRRWLPKFLPFRKTSNKLYRKLSIAAGDHKAFILNRMFYDPALNLVPFSDIDTNLLFHSVKENNVWNSIQRMTLNAMIDHYATLIWRCAKAIRIEILFPYIHRDLMEYGLSLHPSEKMNKAPIRWLMQHYYKMSEMNYAKGQRWDKIGWGGVYKPYFECDKFINAISVFRTDCLWEYCDKNTAGRYWHDAFRNGDPNPIALRMAMFNAIMELNK